MARCANVVHDLGSAEPRSRVEPTEFTLCCTALHQLELGSNLHHVGATRPTKYQ